MRLLYHDDVIPKVHAAFMLHTDDLEKAHVIFDTYFDELCSSPTNKEQLRKWNANASEEAVKLAKMLDEIDDQYTEIVNMSIGKYQPENIAEDKVRQKFLALCATGNFVPFVLAITKRDLEDRSHNVLVIIAGLGEHPDENFVFLGIDYQQMQQEFNIKADDIPENQVTMIYPIIYDALNGVLYSNLTDKAISIKSCITHKENE